MMMIKGGDKCDGEYLVLVTYSFKQNTEIHSILISGIQAKLYNQDLSLDASFDAGGNIGR